MINFRFHIVSLVAMFLALGVGVIMGTAVIDSAVVDQLQSQQRGLEARIEDVTGENDGLRRDLKDLRAIDDGLSEEGGPLLLHGALRGASVAVVAVKGTAEDVVAGLVTQLAAADADVVGVVWVTDRLVLDGGDEVRDLAAALGLAADSSVATLRATMATRLAAVLRGGPATEAAGSVLPALVRGEFVEVERANGDRFEVLPSFPSSTVVTAVVGPQADLTVDQGPLLLVRALIRSREDGLRVAPVLVAEPTPATGKDGKDVTGGLLRAVRDDDGDLGDRVSTVDDLEHLAGRLAAVLAVADLRLGRVGHYGKTDGADRLIPVRDTA